MSKPWPKLYSECLRKKRFTYNQANTIIKKKKKNGVELYMYLCPYCNGHHLTSKPQLVSTNNKVKINEQNNIQKFIDVNQILQWYYKKFGQKISFNYGYSQYRSGIKWVCYITTQYGQLKEEGSTKKQAKKRVLEDLVEYMNRDVKYKNTQL